MKTCYVKNNFFKSILFVICSIVLILILTSCFSSEKIDKLRTESGIVVEGVKFEEGSVLEANIVDSKNQEYSSIITKIEGEKYDKTKDVYVFDLSIIKDGVKVKLNGKVKVSIPVTYDLTGYDVLHIKDNGEIERLNAIYKSGIVTFETESFSKFVFVKRIESSDLGNDDKDDENINKKYKLYTVARRIVPASFSEGGAVRDINDEDITYRDIEIAEGTSYTVKAHCYPDYYFVGWYEADDLSSSTEDTFISSDSRYTVTMDSDKKICAVFAYKTDPVKLELGASSCGFSYRFNEPINTIVLKDSLDRPTPENVQVMGILANGGAKNYGYYSSGMSDFNDYITYDDGGVDYSKLGKYTITYKYKNNPNICASLKIEVVEKGYSLDVSTKDDNLKFRYNSGFELNNLNINVPKGKLVTLYAELKNGYAFTGWYDEDDNLVSKDFVYCFEMPEENIVLKGKYETSQTYVNIDFSAYGGYLVDKFGNSYSSSGTRLYLKTNESIEFEIIENDYYEFLGWYSGEKRIEDSNKLELTVKNSMDIIIRFREKMKYIELDQDKLLGDNRLVYSVGDEINLEEYDLYGKTVLNSYFKLEEDDFILDLSDVDFKVPGTYKITYAYKYNNNIKTELSFVLVNPNNIEFSYQDGYSYLDHEYNGKATFISLKDVLVNNIPLYEFKSNSKIWNHISYKWINIDTNEVVDTKDLDITINGTVVNNFGPSDDKITIGNEFGGPIKAGSYRFELLYDEQIVLTKNATIYRQEYKKINSKSDFKTNEGSTWVNFELYYYTIVGYANGKYFVMQMPSIGYGEYEVEAREVNVDSNGNILLGDDNDFAFVNMRYLTNDNSGYTEFLTGYYGSYVVKSSSNTSDGTMFGTPYIYRTGYTSLSGGKIYREYGDKEFYGMSTEFESNGAVTIYSRYYGETSNNMLRLVKDNDKYVFTSVNKDTDTRESFDVFIYQSVLEKSEVNSNK